MHCTVTKREKTKKKLSFVFKMQKVEKPKWKDTVNLLGFYKVRKGCIQEQWTQFQRDLNIG